MAARARSRRTEPPPDRGSRRDWRPDEVELVRRPEGGRQARIAAAAADCLLDRYRAGSGDRRNRVPLITARQHAAGLKLRALWDAAERLPRLIARYEPAPLGLVRGHAAGVALPDDGLALRQHGARRALASALAGLDPPDRQLVENVCRHDLAARTAMPRLRRALDHLADHWHLAEEEEQ